MSSVVAEAPAEDTGAPLPVTLSLSQVELIRFVEQITESTLPELFTRVIKQGDKASVFFMTEYLGMDLAAVYLLPAIKQEKTRVEDFKKIYELKKSDISREDLKAGIRLAILAGNDGISDFLFEEYLSAK